MALVNTLCGMKWVPLWSSALLLLNWNQRSSELLRDCHIAVGRIYTIGALRQVVLNLSVFKVVWFFSAISSFQVVSLHMNRASTYSTANSEEGPRLATRGVGSRADPRSKTGKKADCQNWDCGQLQDPIGKAYGRRWAKAMVEMGKSPSLGTGTHYTTRIWHLLSSPTARLHWEQRSGLNGREEPRHSIYDAQDHTFAIAHWIRRTDSNTANPSDDQWPSDILLLSLSLSY